MTNARPREMLKPTRRCVLALVIGCALLTVATVPAPSPAQTAPGVPAGVGIRAPHSAGFQYFLDLAKKYKVGPAFTWCSDMAGHAFRKAYTQEQDWIRSQFHAGYMLGYPSGGMKALREGRTNMRVYQSFRGGSWGSSMLVQPNASYFTKCWSQPFLVTGSILKKWGSLGYHRILGGPQGGQFRSGSYVNQRFKYGEIGFLDPADVWWHRYGEPWQR